jgi:hypothetical protein
MAAVHMALTRHLNCIYLQAPHIPANEQANFIQYMKLWCKILQNHHGLEERDVFPAIEAATKIPGLMSHNVDQHHVFEGPVKAFGEHVEQLEQKPKDYDATRVLQMIDAFAPALIQHLEDEISTLANIPDHLPADVKPSDIDLEAISKEEGDKAAKEVGLTEFYAFSLHLDRTYADGKFKDFPPLPLPATILIGYVMPWFSSLSKFAACDAHGQPRELLFAPPKNAAS